MDSLRLAHPLQSTLALCQEPLWLLFVYTSLLQTTAVQQKNGRLNEKEKKSLLGLQTLLVGSREHSFMFR